MMPEMIHEAFGAESLRLSEVVPGLDDAAFARPTPCDPWTAAAARLRAETGWDQVTLIAGLTGRRPLSRAETGLVESAGCRLVRPRLTPGHDVVRSAGPGARRE